METLIPIASKLQDVLGALGQTTALDLPQIVVVGGQSAGKSSVLEAIVGRSFLPRGSGIVTRRPLVLQLYNTSSSGDDANEGSYDPEEEWGEFLHQPGKRYHDFVAIRAEIEKETDRLTGTNKGLSHSPIYLKIFSPKVLPLTIVDLPGIARIPIGDQPEDIEDQIRAMCMEYISRDNSIILAVTAGNQDLSTSDALKLAQSVDPYGVRTVGVLTKVDLMDEGTDASEILMNRVIPLRRGYIAVVNRGQKDVNADLSIVEEEAFFRSHPVYGRDRTILSKCGTKRLAAHLNVMLMHHIRDCLPDLKNRITSMAADVNQELEALGSPASLTSGPSAGGELLRLLSKFSTNFTAIIEGRGGQNDLKSHRSKCNPFRELFGGARISYIFTEVFAASIMGVGSFDGLTDEEIRTTICNAHGTRPALFVPEVSFDILIRRQIARLEQPGVSCVDLVYEELQRIASQAEPSELTRFPFLRDRMVEVVNTLLKRCMEPTMMMVANLVKIELAYINTSHPDFIGGSRAVAQLMEQVGKENDERMNASSSGRDTGPKTVHTPLSSTANFGNNADHYGEEPSPGFASPSYNDQGDSGIMNFIFRGKPKLSKIPGNGNTGPPSVVHLPQVPDTMRQSDTPPTERDRVEMEVIKSLIDSYFKIVRKNFIDLVPKTIMYYLVNHVRDAMQNELVSELYRDAEVGNLMQEAEDIAQRRQTCEEMSDLLKKAMEIVNEVRDFNTFK